MKRFSLIPAVVLTLVFTINPSYAQSRYVVTERGANYDVLQKTTVENGVNHVHKYTELATGLNYTNASGQWVESKEQISILSDGSATATNGQHKVYFPSDIYEGVIEVVTPDGKHLQSRPLGLSYFDGTNSVLIAELTNSIGVVVGSNQVIYPDVFTDFKADLRYTYTKAGFEQDVILREQPSTPESFGLNPQTTRLQMLTEFFGTNQPVQTALSINRDGLRDTTLTFGKMKMVRGKAFSINDNGQRKPPAGGTPTYKSWQHLNGRTFLVEELPVQRIKSQLEELPGLTNAVVSSASSIEHKISSARLLPPLRLVQTATNGMQLAKVDFNQKQGVVLDYMALDNEEVDGSFTFASNQTYYVSGYSQVDDLAVFQGGTVIKYAPGADLYIGGAECQTGPYNMATFTAKDDDSVGEIISGSSGTPSGYYASAALDFGGGTGVGELPSLSYLRFCHAEIAIYNPGADIGFDLLDSQLIQCDIGVLTVWMSASEPTFSIRNVLIDQIGTAAFAGEDFIAQAENVTISGANAGVSSLASAVNDLSDYGLSLVNCLGMNNVYWGFDGTTPLSGTDCYSNLDASAFQSVGAGNYYLAANSPYRNAGITNVDGGTFNGPPLLPELRQKTTYPPITMSGGFSASQVLYPRVQRDTDAIDLGYHYDALDYLTDGLTVEAGARLTLTNGVAVGVNGSITLDGTLFAPIQFTNACVQEQPSAPISVLIGALYMDITWDSEGDGLPDSWELMYFGNLAQTAAGDADGDGVDNLQEFVNGTNPTGSGVVSIFSEFSSTGSAIRPSPGFAAVPGEFLVSRDVDGYATLVTNLTVHFIVSGTASNGVDYVLRDQLTGEILTNSITILSNNPSAEIEIDPTTNLLCLSNLTVAITLVRNTNDFYLVDSGAPLATNLITANIFSVIASTIPSPTGIDYHPPTHSLIVSGKDDDAGFWSFYRIDTNGVVTNWSSVRIPTSVRPEEVKLATVKATANGFTNGAMYFGSASIQISPDGFEILANTNSIGWLSPDSSVSNLDYFTDTDLEGLDFLGLCIDQSGSFGGNLIALQHEGGVWRFKADGTVVTNYSAAGGDEGVISLTNDVAKYGPLAGKIMTGLTAVGANGLVTNVLGLVAEDCDVIPTNQDLYCNDDDEGFVLKVSKDVFTNHVGDVLITQPGFEAADAPLGLIIVHWDAASTNFVYTSLPLPGVRDIEAFEHVTFAPIDIPPISP